MKKSRTTNVKTLLEECKHKDLTNILLTKKVKKKGINFVEAPNSLAYKIKVAYNEVFKSL